jgi:hypothetical protein
LTFTCDFDGALNVYTTAVDPDGKPAGVVRRLTSFVTAAFDPVWTRNGDLVCSVFDAYSFQIRRIPGAYERIDSARVAALKRDRPSGPWTPASLGEINANGRLPYSKSYHLDIAQSAISTDPVFGTVGGAAVSISDMLGDDAFYLLLYNTAQTTSDFFSSFNLAVSHISLKHRMPFAYGVFNTAGRRYDLTDPDEYFFERSYGGYVATAWPLSKFRRIEGSVSLSYSNKEAIYEDRKREALLVGNSISYVHDNALYYYTGPIDGSRFNITLGYTTDVLNSKVNYYTVMADYRRYIRLDLRTVLAMRLEFLYNCGEEARRYFMGGSWDLRGWPRWSIRGTKRWLTSAELRFPLLERVGLDFAFGSINLGLLRGAIFVDAGNCWDGEYKKTLGSFGAGLRFSVFGIIVLRYDLGKRIEENFTKIQSGLFHQFFFGWDF